MLAPRRGLIANFAWLAGGTAVGQALGVLAAPLLTRVYGPEDMGRLGLYMSFVGFGVTCTALRYDYAIVAARSAVEAAHLALVSAMLVVPVSIALALVLWLLIQGQMLGFGALPLAAAPLVLLSLLATGAASTLRFWLVRNEAFKRLSGVVIWQSGVRAAAQVSVGLAGVGWLGLLLGDVFGRATGVLRMLRLAWPVIVPLVLPLDRVAVRHVLTGYRKFPLYDLPSAVIDKLAVSLVVPLLSLTYGAAAAGYLPSCMRPGGARRVRGRQRGGRLSSADGALHALGAGQRAGFFFGTAALLLLVGLLPTAVLAAFGPGLFSWLFGPTWVTAGELASVTAPWALAALVVSPVSRVIAVFQAQELKFVYDVGTLLGVVGALILARGLQLELLDAVRLLSLAQVAAYAIYFGLLVFVIRRAGVD